MAKWVTAIVIKDYRLDLDLTIDVKLGMAACIPKPQHCLESLIGNSLLLDIQELNCELG